MNSLVLFFACLAGIVVLGWGVSRVTGARAQFIETFALEPGEHVLWEDWIADAYPIPTRQALIVTYVRSRRRAVRVTNKRILAGSKPLFGKNHMIQHMLYPSDRAFPEAARALGGGLLTRGFQTLVFERESCAQPKLEKHPFVDLTLLAALPSSINLLKFRIYSDRLESFCLPE